MRKGLMIAAATVIGAMACVDDSPTGTPIDSQISNITACHNGSGNSAVVNASDCFMCDSARVNGDWSHCINSTAHELGDGGTLQFLRDSTYEVSSTLWTGGCVSFLASGLCNWKHQHNDVRWEATGSGARPVIKFTTMQLNHDSTIYTAGIKVSGHNVWLVDLDIRGTSYGDSSSLMHANYGINAGIMSVDGNQSGDIVPAGLRLYGVEVNGFREAGMLWTGTDLIVENSQFRWNSYTGLALFSKEVAQRPGVIIRGSDISDNGGDGIDMTPSHSLIEDNTIRNNGWLWPTYQSEYPYEAHGIILNPSGDPPGSVMDSVTVRNNVITGNGLSGIQLISNEFDSFTNITIETNTISDHAAGYSRNNVSGGWAVYFGKRYDDVGQVGDINIASSILRDNCAYDNDGDGDFLNWNLPSQGVTAPSNGCEPFDVSIIGPTTVKPNQLCTWTATVQGGVSPYTYAWDSDGYTGPGDDPTYQTEFGFTGYAAIWVTVYSSAGSGWAYEPLAVWVSDTAPNC